MATAETKTVSAMPECELFAGLDDSELEAIARIAHPLTLDPGEKLFRLGDSARSSYVVRSGEMALTHPITIQGNTRELTLQTAGAGALLGWSALVKPYRRTLGARAKTVVELVGLNREALEDLFRERMRLHLVLSVNLSQVIGSRVALLEALLLQDLERWVSEIE